MGGSQKSQLLCGSVWWLFGGSDKSRLVTASARSDVSLLWRRLVVVAHSSMTSSMTVCGMPDQVSTRRCGGQLSHALQSCKLVPAWYPRHGSRPGSSLGCLAATGRVHWILESPAAVAGQCRERGELGRYHAGTRTCHHRPLTFTPGSTKKGGEQPSFETATETISDLLNVGRQHSKRSAAVMHFVVSRGAYSSAYLSDEATENTFSSVKKKNSLYF